jgi:hypothetical protein
MEDKIKFYEIDLDLEYDGDETDLRLHGREKLNWGAETAAEYEEATNAIDAISYKGNGWEVYATYDVSGFDYWMMQQEEPNYINMTIMFDNDTVDVTEITAIKNAMDMAYSDAYSIAEKYDYVPNDVNSSTVEGGEYENYVNNIYERQSEYGIVQPLYSFVKENGYSIYDMQDILEKEVPTEKDAWGDKKYSKKAIRKMIGVISGKYAKGSTVKGVYSSDEMFTLNVYNLKNELLSSKNFRAKNQKDANQIAEYDYEEQMQKKFGKDLRFEVKLAPNKYANGGGVGLPYYVYNKETNTIEKYFDNEIEAEEFAAQFENAEVYKNDNDNDDNDNETIEVEIVQDKAYGKGYYVIRKYNTNNILHDSIEGLSKAYRVADDNGYEVIYAEGYDKDEYKRGGKVDGRSTRAKDTWNRGSAWTRDRNAHNKSEDWEKPLNQRGKSVSKSSSSSASSKSSSSSSSASSKDKSKKYMYIPNYMIRGAEVNNSGKTTDIDGANILDGIYVKAGTKYAEGGGIGKKYGDYGKDFTNSVPIINLEVGKKYKIPHGGDVVTIKKIDISGEYSKYPIAITSDNSIIASNYLLKLDNEKYDKFAKGGGVGNGYMVFNYTDNLYASNDIFATKKEANNFIAQFRKRFEQQGYYRDSNMNKIDIDDIDLLVIDESFNPFRYAEGGGVPDLDKKMALINLDMIHEYSVKLDNIVTEETELEEWVKMKLTRIEQNVADVKHAVSGGEKFDKGGMIFKKQLLHISKYAKELIDMIQAGSNLMAWQENKLAIAADNIDGIYHYMDYLENENKKISDAYLPFANGGGVGTEYFKKLENDFSSTRRGGLKNYSVDIDLENGEQLRGGDLDFKDGNDALFLYERVKKKGEYQNEKIEDIQLIVNFKNGDYETVDIPQYAKGSTIDGGGYDIVGGARSIYELSVPELKTQLHITKPSETERIKLIKKLIEEKSDKYAKGSTVKGGKWSHIKTNGEYRLVKGTYPYKKQVRIGYLKNVSFNDVVKLEELLNENPTENFSASFYLTDLGMAHEGSSFDSVFIGYEIENEIIEDGRLNVFGIETPIVRYIGGMKKFVKDWHIEENEEYKSGGKVPRNVGRDWLFKSKQKWEQNYDRKREWKEYKKEGWFANWFKDGGSVGFGEVYNEVVKVIMAKQNISYDEAVDIINNEEMEAWLRNMVEYHGETDANFLAEQILTTDEGKYAKGGRVKNYKYVPNYMIESVDVERNGKTTEIDGGNILDGLYVKGKVAFEEGGYVENIPTETLEGMIGRKLNGWNDDKVIFNGIVYKKCFMKPYYKIA